MSAIILNHLNVLAKPTNSVMPTTIAALNIQNFLSTFPKLILT